MAVWVQVLFTFTVYIRFCFLYYESLFEDIISIYNDAKHDVGYIDINY